MNTEYHQKQWINPLIILVIYYLTGIISFLTDNILLGAGVLIVITFYFLLKNIISAKSAIIFYTIFALGILNCHIKIKNYDDLSQYIPTEATLTGTVSTIPTTNNTNKTKFHLNVNSITTNNKETDKLKAKTIVTLYDTEENYSKIKIGDTIKIAGKLRNPMTSKNPSQFDYSKYLKYHNTFSNILNNQIGSLGNNR